MPKRILSGVVVSANSNKTITVNVIRRIKHKLYKKIIRQTKKYHAHDEKNEFNVDIIDMSRKYENMNIWQDHNHVAFNPKSEIFSNDIYEIIIDKMN